MKVKVVAFGKTPIYVCGTALIPTYTETQNFELATSWLRARALARLPLIEDLTRGPVPPGTQILVEFDPASQWYNASFTIAAEWLKTGGEIGYSTFTRTPDEVRVQLSKLGLNVEELEKAEALQIYDYYTVTLGHRSKDKYAVDSLKVADLSIMISKKVPPQLRAPAVTKRSLAIGDNRSNLARFNDEKSWVEYTLSRTLPSLKDAKITALSGVVIGVHSDWVYKTLEGAHDAIVDFKLEEIGRGIKNLMRIRTMRNVPYDSDWHHLKISENFKVTLER